MKSKRREGRVLMVTGLLLVAAALFLTLYNVWESKHADELSADVLMQLNEQIGLEREDPASAQATSGQEAPDPAQTQPSAGENSLQFTDAAGLDVTWSAEDGAARQPAFVLNPEMEMPTEKINGNYYIGVLEIPSLGLELPVMSDWSYPRLRIAPCRYKGSAYSGDLIIAGHNYARHFSGIKRMSPGDEVRFTDADGNLFLYKVAELETLGGADVEKMQSGDWELTLFTCTYGGRSRVAVRCELQGYESR